MRKNCFYIIFGAILFNFCAIGQKTINLGQADSRFTFSATRKWEVGSEQYRFYVTNNTSTEYELVIKVNLDLACVGSKSFLLGYNYVVYLKPNGKFDAFDDDHVHIYTSGADNFKSCRLSDGESFTLYKGMSYRIERITNLTEKKEKEKQAALQSKIKSADDDFNNKKYNSASIKYKEVLEADPGNAYAETRISEINEINRKAQEVPAKQAASTETIVNTNGNKAKSKSGSTVTEQVSANSNTQTIKSSKPSPAKGTIVSTNRTTANSKSSSTATEQVSANTNTQTIESSKPAQHSSPQKEYIPKKDPDWVAEQQLKYTEQSFYSAIRVIGAKNNYEENKTLKSSYESAEELENDFNQKYSSISNNMAELEAARNQNMQDQYSNLFFNSDESTQAIGGAALIVGTVANSVYSRKEEERAKEELRRQKEQHLKDIENRKIKMRVEMRKMMLTKFRDGGTPLSSHKVPNAVYFFAYSVDTTNIHEAKPPLIFTNVFKLQRFDDGTWIFKKSLVKNLSKVLIASSITVVGYYTEEKTANDMHSAFKSLADKCKFELKEVLYKEEKKTSVEQGSPSANSDDFWDR